MSTLTDRIRPWTTPTGPRLSSGSLVSPGNTDPSSYIAIDRIHPWITNPPHNSPAGETAILIIVDQHDYPEHSWVAFNRGDLEPIAQGGSHPTKVDALLDAIEHVPNWNIIRSL